MHIVWRDGHAHLIDESGADLGRLVLASAPQDAVVAAAAPARMHWEGVMALEEIATGDGRMMAAGSLEWVTPFPLTWRPEDGGHGGRTVGTVWEVERRGNAIWATGTFDLTAPASAEFPEGIGLEIARQIDAGVMEGTSVELDSWEIELRVREEVLAEMEDTLEAMDDNQVATEGDDVDADGRVLLDRMVHDDFLEVTTSARVRTLAVVTTPAHDEAVIALAPGVTLDGLRSGTFPQTGEAEPADGEVAADPEAPVDATEGAPSSAVDEDGMALAASAGPVRPPAAWFDDPAFGDPEDDDRLVPVSWDDDDQPTAYACPLTITADGQIFGHVAPWGSCHVGRPDTCLTPPPSRTDYAHFTVGETEVDCSECPDADRFVPTGTITMRTVHPSLAIAASDAFAHYAHTGAAVADVSAGEDQHGIWIAGSLRSTVTEEQLRELRGSGLSGDWRRIGSGLEMIAALAVNAPGFPIPRRRLALAAAAGVASRPRALVRRGRAEALVASGPVAAGTVLPELEPSGAVPESGFVTLEALPLAEDRRLERIERALRPQIAESLRREVFRQTI